MAGLRKYSDQGSEDQPVVLFGESLSPFWFGSQNQRAFYSRRSTKHLTTTD
jgi:hypothetical protein